MKHRYIIGIDPDSSKSGFAWIDSITKEVDIYALDFPGIVLKLCNGRGLMPETLVVVEASWLNNRHNWHNKATDSRRVANAKGYDVGRNHQTGMLIVEMCRNYNIEVIDVNPLRKCWKGRDGKITHEEIAELFKDFKNFPTRTNQEGRDAALLALNYSELPMKISCKKP